MKYNAPCWTCKKVIGSLNFHCNWSMRAKPVKGWEAKPFKISSNGKCADTFWIRYCPEYVREVDCYD